MTMANRSILQKHKESHGPGDFILQVGVIGSAGHEEYLEGWKPAEGLLDACRRIGELLGKRGATIVTGGGGGIMEAVAREGIKYDSITVGIYNNYLERGVGDFYTVGFTTGMLEGGPEYLLPLCSDVLIAISGGSGTLNELTVAYRNDIPVVLLKGFGGWVDQLIPLLHDGKYLDERKRVIFEIADTADQAVELALRLGVERLEKTIKLSKEFFEEENKRRTGKRRIF